MPFKKGQSGNPSGRASHNLEEFKAALRSVEKDKGPFFIHCIEQAYTDPQMARAVLGKFVPDLRQLDGELKIQHLNLMREVVRELAAKRVEPTLLPTKTTEDEKKQTEIMQ